jgi:hypothetical protein
MANGDSDSKDQMLTIAAGVGTSVGALGFVAFAGGVILWKRFSEMGLPAADSVAKVPNSVLLATGAEFLVPALLVTAAIAILLVGMRTLREAKDNPPADRTARVVKALAEIVPARSPFLAGGLLLGEGLRALFDAPIRGHLDALAVLLVLAAAGAIVIWVALHKHASASTVALVAFFAVGTFWIARAYLKTAEAPTVLPMAYSRQVGHGPPRVEGGYLVAETSDRIWFASIPHPMPGLPNELREFPRDETDDLEIGNLMGPKQAAACQLRFIYNLCVRLQASGEAPSGCPSDQAEAPRCH